MQQLCFIPVSHGVWCLVRSAGGAGVEEGLELRDGRAAVEIVAGGFDVEAVDGEGEFAVADRGCEGHGVTMWLGSDRLD